MIFWSGAILFFIAFVWMFKSILTPFVLGIVIAYLLNPLLKRFSTKGIKRTTSTIVILSLFFILLTTIVTLVAPIVAKESTDLIKQMPVYTEKFLDWITHI